MNNVDTIERIHALENEIIKNLGNIDFDMSNIYNIAHLADKCTEIKLCDNSSNNTCYNLISDLSYGIYNKSIEDCIEYKKNYIDFISKSIEFDFEYKNKENLSMDSVFSFIKSSIPIIKDLKDILKDEFDCVCIVLKESFFKIFPIYYHDMIAIILQIICKINNVDYLISEPELYKYKLNKIRANIIPINKRLLYNSNISLKLKSINFKDNLSIGRDLQDILGFINNTHACESESTDELIEIYRAVEALDILSRYDTITDTDSRISFSTYIKLAVYIEAIFYIIKYHTCYISERYSKYFEFLIDKTFSSITKIYNLSSDSVVIMKFIIDKCRF